jgi:excisionase family DNA binding protein
MTSPETSSVPDPTPPERLAELDGELQKLINETLAAGVPDPRTHPTLTVPQAGRLLGLAKASAYEGAHRGEIPTIRVGRRLLVPTAALRRMLQLDGPPAS